MEKRDIRLYKKLTVLAEKQLAAIDRRLSRKDVSRWSESVFKLRHARIKNILANILERREKKSGRGAVIELINDLKYIGESREEWPNAGTKETDYLRFILHGIRAVPEKSGESC